jgi:hypothetical protein
MRWCKAGHFVLFLILVLLACTPRTYHSKHFDITYQDAFWGADKVAVQAEEALDKISTYFGLDFKGRIEIEENVDERFAGLANHRRNLILLSKYSRHVIFHEVAHILTIGGDTNPKRYLHEGVAVFVEDRFTPDELEKRYSGGLHRYVAEHREDIVPLDLLDQEPVFSRGKYFSSGFQYIGLVYAQSGSFVKYLIEEHGLDRFKILLFDYRPYRDVYGMTLDELEKRWLAYIDEQ